MTGFSIFLGLAIASTTPILLTALGGAISERARATNIAMDGSMLLSALAALVVAYGTGNPWLGVLAGTAAGGALALVLAAACYLLGADIIISGIALNLVASGLALVFVQAVMGAPGTYAPSGAPRLPRVDIGPLADIPVIGPALDDQSVFVYVAIALVFVASLVTKKTRFGLWVRAVGENEESLRAAGVQPNGVRTAALLVSGVTAGLGGSYLTLSSVAAFSSGVTGGMGFIALAAILFARSSIVGTAAASLLFGAAMAAAVQLQSAGLISPILLQGLPYAVTILVLAIYGIRLHRRRRFLTTSPVSTAVVVPE